MEPYAGRWSRLVAREFVPWLDTTPQLVWLDLGCGTGALTHATLTAGSPGMLVAFDRSINDLVAGLGTTLGALRLASWRRTLVISLFLASV